MEAKETVIKPDELGLAIIKHPELPMGQAISIEQAEITWDKAIREVVEFFNSMGFAQIDSAYVQNKLKAKLKEWGIK